MFLCMSHKYTKYVQMLNSLSTMFVVQYIHLRYQWPLSCSAKNCQLVSHNNNLDCIYFNGVCDSIIPFSNKKVKYVNNKIHAM